MALYELDSSNNINWRGIVSPRSAGGNGSGGRRLSNSTSTTKNLSKDQISHLKIMLLQTIIVVILYQFELFRYVLYPFFILSTIFHEFGHAIVAILTGASMPTIELEMDESGATRFSGGIVCLILPSGYLGSSLIGSLLLIASWKIDWAIKATWTLLGILVLTLFWSLRDPLSAVYSSILIAIVFYSLRYKKGRYNRQFILFLGVICSIKSILNLMGGTVANNIKESDAYVFSERCVPFPVPAQFIGLIWMVMSIVIIIASLIVGIYLSARYGVDTVPDRNAGEV